MTTVGPRALEQFKDLLGSAKKFAIAAPLPGRQRRGAPEGTPPRAPVGFRRLIPAQGPPPLGSLQGWEPPPEKLQLGIKNTRRFRTRLTQTGAKPAGVFVLAGFTYFFTRTPTYWGWSERESRSLALPDRDRRQVSGRAGSPAPSRLWLVKPCRSLWRTLFQSSPNL